MNVHFPLKVVRDPFEYNVDFLKKLTSLTLDSS